MSPSKIQRLFGIYKHKIKDIRFKTGVIEVELIRTPRRELRCSKCKSDEISLYGTKDRVVRDLPVIKRPVYVKFTQNIIKCARCGIFSERLSFLDKYARHTGRLEKFIHMLCQKMTISDVSRVYGLSWDEVRRIDKKYLNKKYSKPKWKKLNILGVDEIALSKGHKYLTIVTNLETGEVIYVGKDRKQESLEEFFIKLGFIRCKRIEAIAMDNWSPYKSAVDNYLQNAKVVFDKFHLLSAFSRTLDDVRRIEFKRCSKKDSSVLKGSRYLLLKPQHLLKPVQRLKLINILNMNENLNLAYILKDDFKQIWESKDKKEAEYRINVWLQMADSAGIKPLKTFANTLLKIKEGILNYFDFKITTGKVEGINNKIKVLKRKAYGYRDIDYFSMKIMDLHNISFGYG